MTESPRTRLLLWEGLDVWRTEAAHVDSAPNGITATGTQIGIDPLPYRLDYRLDASDNFLTRSLEATAAGEAWSRKLRLASDGRGTWQCDAEGAGVTDLPPPGCDPDILAGALDCDLGFSPLTNSLPVLRHQLIHEPGAQEFLMAWVSVPDLSVVASRQRYEHVETRPHGSVVRFVDLGLFEGFTAELTLDAEGFVVLYPHLARRVAPAAA